jgi:hypothetical protein
MSTNSKSVKNLSESSLKQITIMKALYTDESSSDYERDLNEITELSGMEDEKETQRYLYILEGHKIVTPKPAGDFTSKFWALTEDGVKTYKQICKDFSLS